MLGLTAVSGAIVVDPSDEEAIYKTSFESRGQIITDVDGGILLKPTFASLSNGAQAISQVSEGSACLQKLARLFFQFRLLDVDEMERKPRVLRAIVSVFDQGMRIIDEDIEGLLGAKVKDCEGYPSLQKSIQDASAVALLVKATSMRVCEFVRGRLEYLKTHLEEVHSGNVVEIIAAKGCQHLPGGEEIECCGVVCNEDGSFNLDKTLSQLVDASVIFASIINDECLDSKQAALKVSEVIFQYKFNCVDVESLASVEAAAKAFKQAAVYLLPSNFSGFEADPSYLKICAVVVAVDEHFAQL